MKGRSSIDIKVLVAIAFIVMMWFNAMDKILGISINMEIVLLVVTAVVTVLAIVSVVDWIKEKKANKKKVVKVLKSTTEIESIIGTQLKGASKNYAIGILTNKKDKTKRLYLAFSDEKRLDVDFEDKIHFCDDKEVLNKIKMVFPDPDGKLRIEKSYEEIKDDHFRLKHFSCAERKILAQIKHEYPSLKKKRLILYTYMEPCAYCSYLIEALKKEGLLVTVLHGTDFREINEHICEIFDEKSREEIIRSIDSLIKYEKRK